MLDRRRLRSFLCGGEQRVRRAFVNELMDDKNIVVANQENGTQEDRAGRALDREVCGPAQGCALRATVSMLMNSRSYVRKSAVEADKRAAFIVVAALALTLPRFRSTVGFVRRR